MLSLPTGAVITYARLYWSASFAGATDTSVTLDRVGTGAFSPTITADASFTATSTTPQTYYQSTADVTALVQAQGVGPYRLGGVDATPLLNLNNDTVYAAWTMVVFYQLAGAPPRNLAIFDGLDLINSTGPSVTVSLSGFLVPNAGFDAKLGVVAYEGDDQLTGDALSFNGVALSDALNPVNNFFNGTRSWLGAAVSNVGDLPQLTGAARSVSGLDLDVVDVTARVARGDTSATITASTNQDFYLLGAFVTSISTYKPDFSGSTKTVTDITTHPGGAVLPGDVIEYTISATNSGNDVATNVVLNDALPTGMTYLPGSIRITGGANVGTKTDATGDDQGEYLAASRTVRVRLGTGATGAVGGTMAVGVTSTVAFRTTLGSTVNGLIQNQAIVTASGQAGAPPADYPSDGNGGGPGAPPTPIVVDGCATNSDCAGTTPLCMTSVSPHVCVGCLAASDCGGVRPTCDAGTHACRACAADADCPAAAPACQPNGACGSCSASNATTCSGATPACYVAAAQCVACVNDTTCAAPTPVCNTASHACVGCLTAADCGGATPVCDPAFQICRGCSGDSDCGGATPACQPSGACGICSASNATQCAAATPVCNPPTGTCVVCVSSAQCAGGTPVCDSGTHTCRGCAGDGECGGATPACQPSGACGTCSAANATLCTGVTPVCNPPTATCVGCVAAAQCQGTAPACDGTTHTCRGCTADADCSGATPACQPSGACGGCSSTNTVHCTGTTPVCSVPTGTCVGCLSGAQCAGATPTCDPTAHACRGCSGDGECGGATPACQPGGACGTCSATNTTKCTGTTAACDTSTGTCVTCATASQCAGATPTCDPTTHTCRACSSDGDCPGATPACQPGGSCGTCSATNRTLCSGATSVCDTSAGHCVACVANADCSGAAPICDGVTHVCRPCSRDAECPAQDPVCTAAGACAQCAPGKVAACPTIQPICDGASATCRPCAADAECPGATPLCLPSGACAACTATNPAHCPISQPLCNTASGVGVCAGCLSDADCGGVTPNCSATTHSCTPCTADGAPSCPNPNRPACQQTGPLAGACTECTPTNAGLCVGAKPQCLPDTGLCGCAGPSADNACGSSTSGLVCSGPNGICTPGCASAPRNGCPSGQTCLGQAAGLGVCTTPTGCTTDADCHDPLPRCDLVDGQQCVQCLTTADCSGGLVCDPPTHACVECTPAVTSACSTLLAGSACLTGGQCGCTQDSDCGGTTSGRVCDASIGRCDPGCRAGAAAAGSNGCPLSEICSSTTDAIGVCRPAPPLSDGGVTDGGTTDGRARDGSTTDGRASDGGAGGRPGDGGSVDGRGGKSGQGRDGGTPDGPDAGSAYNSARNYVAGGGCRCDLGAGSPSSRFGVALIGLFAIVIVRRRRGR